MAIKTYKKGSSKKLSKNFRAREFDCPGGSCCKETVVDEKLVEYLQKIRDHFEKPVNVLGYRCPTHNAKIKNVAKKSKHIDGMAADINIKGVEPAEIAKYAESIGVKGIGLYDTEKDGHFVHIDTRPQKFFWFGHAQERRSTFGGSPKVKYSQEQFVKDVQKAFGVNATGVYDKDTLKATKTISTSKNSIHIVVSYIQKRLIALGYVQVGSVDCIAGDKFTKAMKAFQKDHKLPQTGRLPARSKYWGVLLSAK